MERQLARTARPIESTGPAFVGRDRELAAVAEALTGGPALVLVEGEAGIGKTRLLQESLRGLDELTVLAAACPPMAEPFPLGPLVDALHRRSIDGVELTPLAGALRPLFPEWAEHLPPALEPLEDPSSTRHRLFRALVELVERSGVDVLVLEDAHWADAATLEFLPMLCASSDRDLSLVVTYRATDVPAGSPLLRLTSRPPAGLRRLSLTLQPLGVDATTALVASIFATDDVSAEFVSFLHRHTGGVPLAVEESVSLLRDRGDIVRRGGEWSRRALDELQVPPTVRDSVLERVARLAPEARRILAAAAVLTDPADEPTLAAVAGLDEEDARFGLAEALSSGLVREAAAGRFVCRHALASRAIEEATPASERRHLHRKAAEALQGSGTAPVARLSRHYREAGDVAAWSRYAEAAADLALESGEDRAAVVVLHELLTTADHPPDRHARLVRSLGEAATWGVAALGDLALEVAETLSSALERYDLPAAQRGEIRVLLGRLWLQLGDFDAGISQVEAAVADLAERPELAVRAMISLAYPRGHDWPVSRHLEWLGRATRAMPHLPEAERVWFDVDRASALLMMGEESGWSAAAELAGEATTLFDQRQLARGLMNVGHSAIGWGRDDDARRQLDRAIELLASTGYQRLMNSALITRALVDWHAGAWDGLADRVGELADSDDTLPEALLEARMLLGLAGLADGRRADAEEHLRTVVAEAGRRGLVDVHAAPPARWAGCISPTTPSTTLCRSPARRWRPSCARSSGCGPPTSRRHTSKGWCGRDAWPRPVSWWTGSPPGWPAGTCRPRGPRCWSARDWWPPTTPRPRTCSGRPPRPGRGCPVRTRNCSPGNDAPVASWPQAVPATPRWTCSPRSSGGCGNWAHGGTPTGWPS